MEKLPIYFFRNRGRYFCYVQKLDLNEGFEVVELSAQSHLPCCCWICWYSRAFRRNLSARVGLGIGAAPGSVPMLRELSERFKLLAPPGAAKCDMLRLMLEALCRGWLCCCSANVPSCCSVVRFLGCAS